MIAGEVIMAESDLISRQVAIDEAKEWIDAVYFEENDKRERKAIECFIGSLKNMPSAQPEQRWIPCSERLPDGRLNKSYLVQDKDGRRAVGTYTNWGWVFGHYMNDPVAWMPLPEPWKEKPNEIH